VTARVWDAATGKLLTTFYTPSDYMTILSKQGQISIYLSIYEIQAMASDGNIYSGISSEFSPDGKLIVTTTWSNPAKVWDAANGELLLTLGKSSSSVRAAAFSPDGGRIVTAGSEGLEIWDAKSGERLFNLKQSNYNPLTLAFSPDGRKIVSTSTDQKAE